MIRPSVNLNVLRSTLAENDANSTTGSDALLQLIDMFRDEKLIHFEKRIGIYHSTIYVMYCWGK